MNPLSISSGTINNQSTNGAMLTQRSLKKIIEESKKANPEKIQKLNVSKRICNKKTLDYINEIFKKTKEIIGKNWHYDENEDKLEFDEKRYQNHNENKNNPTITIFNFTKENKSRNIQTIPKNLKINETDIKIG
jgi:cysteinyl-tRNA synthetase